MFPNYSDCVNSAQASFYLNAKKSVKRIMWAEHIFCEKTQQDKKQKKCSTVMIPTLEEASRELQEWKNTKQEKKIWIFKIFSKCFEKQRNTEPSH